MLDGERSYTQNKEASQKTRIKYKGGQYVMYVWVPINPHLPSLKYHLPPAALNGAKNLILGSLLIFERRGWV